MLRRNPRTRLLEEVEQNYALQDRSEPRLFRNYFPYDDIPKISFNNIIVPREMPERIYISDTTFRDGQQSLRPYSVKQITDIFDMLHRLGGPNGIVRQCEFFLYSKKDKEAVYKCMERDYKYPRITGWIRASKNDFKLVREMGVKETGILVSCSDYHIFNKMKMTRRKALEHYLSVVKECIETGVTPRCHLEDITRADFYQFVVPLVHALHDLGKELNSRIKIRMCDTLGYGVSIPGVQLPRSVPGIVYGLRRHAEVPSECLEWHGHNDFYRAVTNATTAWIYGAGTVNCSILGIGERTGNTPLEAMVFEYAQLRGSLDGMETSVITELAEYFEKEVGYRIPPRTPFVGSDFNLTRAGIHADGILKNEEIYNIFDTEKFLNRPVKVAVSKTSGAAGIARWINERYDPAIDKKSKIVDKIKNWIDEQYDEGRVTSITDKELEGLYFKYKGEKNERSD